jgi:membrane dipeptidase
MQLTWQNLNARDAEAADGAEVELAGFAATAMPASHASYFLLVDEAPCCVGCIPRDRGAAVEVFSATPVPLTGRRIRLRGTWRVQRDDPTGWRHQLHAARLAEAPGWASVGRRFVLGGAPLMCLAAIAPGPAQAAEAEQRAAAAQQAVRRVATVDMHSHAAGIIGVRSVTNNLPLGAVAEPMRTGSMAAVCFAMVADSPCHKVMADHRIHPYRSPDPGELYAYAQLGFARVHRLIREEKLAVVTNAASLAAARGGTPSAIVACEGADFLEGRPERVDEAYERWQLRHMQLVHYRVNELGDIQTEAPEHNGLTDAGAEVIRRCNRRGIVVDVAHATYEVVQRAATVTTKPVILSHTSLSQRPSARSRLISPDHAKLVAGTGGVIGVWPPKATFPDLVAMANGMARLVDVVGVDHVGLGTDMLGLVGPSVFNSYRDLPDLAAAMLEVGFSPDDVGKVLGGNYGRVFAACMV